MNLYLISQDANSDYDTYDSAVVAALSMDEARRTHPSDTLYHWSDEAGAWLNSKGERPYSSSWAYHIDQVGVRKIGSAGEGVEPGVILASFNAG